jgi:fructokinase
MFLVCGEALFDIFVTAQRADGLALDARPGGSPYNVAIGLARLGQPVEFLTGLCDDVLGRRLLSFMQPAGVGLKHAVRSERPTAFSLVDLDAAGVPAYAFYPEVPAYSTVRVGDLPQLGADIRAVHIGSIATVLEPIGGALAHLAERECASRLISYDPNVRLTVVPEPAVWRSRLETLANFAHLLKISAEDLDLLYPGRAHEAAARAWLAQGVRLVVITRGSRGAAAWTREGHAELPGRAVTVVDTVGAGDSYQAALLAGLAEAGCLAPERLDDLGGAALAGLLGFAAEAAAVTCTRRGADLPRRADLGPLTGF